MTKANKDKLIKFRCTAEEHAAVEALAHQNGFNTISDYARFMLTRESEVSPNEFRTCVDDAHQLTLELRKTISNSGSTLFQATRRLTTINEKNEVIPSIDADNTRLALSQAPEALASYQSALREVKATMRNLNKCLR